MLNIHVSDVDGKPATCFDTGLEPRSFARTKMSQCLIEPGYIVYPDGTHKVWKATGVNEVDGFMRVWGSPFTGKRLDFLLGQADSGLKTTAQEVSLQAALQAVAFWIHCKLLLGDVRSALNPGAIFISSEGGKDFPKGTVFFAPENLSQRCLLVEGLDTDYYNCPDLKGMEAAAFQTLFVPSG
jgi:hypothetical protein